MSKKDPVVIVGAGVAGLCCALDLKAQGIPVLLLEREDAVGGRVRTEELDGFRLDRGFQVWLEAYPECRKRLNPEKLQAGAFGSGAVIYDSKKLRLFADPFRHPRHLLASALHPVGSLMDKLRMQILRSRLAKISLQELFEGEEFSTLEHWQRQGFSPKMIQGFLAPFFRGIFLTEPENVSRRMFDFVFSMFGQGRALLPAGGMQAIPESLAEGLAETELRLKTPVERVEAKRVWTTSGEEISASAVVVTAPELKPFNLNTAEYLTPPHSVSCLYFDAPIAPVNGPWFILNGSGTGQITQVSVNSSVAEGYAPQGRHLISVSVNGSSTNKESERVQNVRTELIDWFGSQVDLWRFLKMMQVDYALPSFEPGQLPGPKWKQEKGIYLCGDGFNHPSLQGAMESGAAVASELIAQGV